IEPGESANPAWLVGHIAFIEARGPVGGQGGEPPPISRGGRGRAMRSKRSEVQEQRAPRVEDEPDGVLLQNVRGIVGRPVPVMPDRPLHRKVVVVVPAVVLRERRPPTPTLGDVTSE